MSKKPSPASGQLALTFLPAAPAPALPVAAPTPPPPTRPTNVALIALFVTHRIGKNYSPRTIKGTRLDLGAFVRAAGGHLLDTTPEQVEEYLAAIIASGRKAGTAKRHLANLREFFRWARKRKLVAGDPSADVEPPKGEARLRQHVSEADLAALLAAGTGQDRMIVQVLYYTGCRASEAAGLDVEHVDLAARQLRLFGKGRKERRIPIPAGLYDELAAWVVRRGDGPLFLKRGARGKRLGYTGILYAFRRVAVAAGLPPMKYTPHCLRHTYATTLVNRGLSIDKIQQLLGHASVATTQIYAHTLIGDDVRQALDEML